MEPGELESVRAHIRAEKVRLRALTPHEGRKTFKAIEAARTPLLAYLAAGAIAHAEYTLIEALAEYGLEIKEHDIA